LSWLLTITHHRAIDELRRRRTQPETDGLQDQQIANELSITPEKAARWRNRFLDGGLAALRKDAPRPGGPRMITDKQIM
jgi:DNA-directed RNA polymerase specialized sigma24 family protein